MSAVYGNDNYREYKSKRGYTYYLGRDGSILDYAFNDASSELKKDAYGYYLLHGQPYHRILYKAFNGDIPSDMEIDHIDRNRTNNNLNNLRVVTH